MASYPIIANFKIIRPTHEFQQNKGYEWLIKAHKKSEETKNAQNPQSYDAKKFEGYIESALKKFGCKESHIQKRGHMLEDFQHEEWDKMEVFNLSDSFYGKSFGERSSLFLKYAFKIFQSFYENETSAPNDLIHVTCTGYNCPSAAQRLVSEKAWNDKTTVTHAYHMGCMASIPAIRMGSGFLNTSQNTQGKLSGKKTQIDIVHTEICSLHLNPSLHAPDQLVGQSLFADGFIKYSLLENCNKGLKVLTIHEEILPKSEELMQWECQYWGLYFTLSKDIPTLIQNHIEGFIQRLLSKTEISYKKILENALFAIHPGGPKIIDQIKDNLSLSSEQVALSREILFNYGNMSSATLPHIWERILNDECYPSKTLILGLAFGPGLTICGVLLEKS